MKLGLLAMSGVRAHNPELTALGLTLPGFVERNRVIASLPSLGLLTRAGAAPEDVPVEYIDVPEVLPSPWLPSGFDAVAISSLSAQIKEASVQTAFPGTPLYDRLRREGRILQEGAWELCTLFDVNFRPSGMSVADLEQGLRELGRRLYDADETTERQRRFRRALRAMRRGTRTYHGGRK